MSRIDPVYQRLVERALQPHTERNRTFIQELSGQLRRLKEDGVYREVLGPFYMPFEATH